MWKCGTSESGGSPKDEGHQGEGIIQDMRVKVAIEWITKRLEQDPAADPTTLIHQASQRFELSPWQAYLLYLQVHAAPE